MWWWFVIEPWMLLIDWLTKVYLYEHWLSWLSCELSWLSRLCWEGNCNDISYKYVTYYLGHFIQFSFFICRILPSAVSFSISIRLCLSLFLSIFFWVFVCMSVILCVSLCMSVCICFHFFLTLSVCTSVSDSVFIYVCPVAVCMYVSVFFVQCDVIRWKQFLRRYRLGQL